MKTRRPTNAAAKRPGITRFPAARPAGAWTALTAAGVLTGPAGQALEVRDLLAFNVGPVVVKPRLSLAASYSDNVYSLPAGTIFEDLGLIRSRDDFFFMIGPELRARLGREGGDRQIDFAYRFDQTLFVENTDSDSSNHSFSLGGSVAVGRIEYDTRNSISLMNSVLSGYEATLEGVLAPSGNVERNSYSTSHTVTYALSAKGRVRLEGSLTHREYPGRDIEQRRFVDSTDWRLRAGYDYAYSQKLRFAVLGHYGQQLRSSAEGFSNLSDADIYGGSVTASGSFTPKLSGNVRVGYEFRDFQQDGGSDGYPLVGVGLTQQFSEKTSVSLNYNRSGSVSASTGGGTVTDSVGLGFQQVLGGGRPWFLNAGIYYLHTDYTEGDRRSENFRFTVGLAYQLRQWASAFINYSFETGERVQGFEYEVNQVMLGLSLGL